MFQICSCALNKEGETQRGPQPQPQEKPRISTDETQMDEAAGSLDGTVSDFGHSRFEFVSSFVLRISHFEKFAHRARILTVCNAESRPQKIQTAMVRRQQFHSSLYLSQRET